MNGIEASIENIINEIAKNESKKIYDLVYPEVEKKIFEEFGCKPQKHVIELPNKKTQINGALHEKFDEVLKIVSLNMPVYLTGKAGTGKNVICQQVAEALGLEFFFTNAVTQEYKLTGFIDANGKYQETQFYKAFTQGGLFFLDEMDASIPEVLVILNAAIANKYFDFPNGKVEAHPDFHVIAAGNTNGLGADINYTGRYCLDRASLDRFAMVNIDYSPTIENNMAQGDKDLVAFAHVFREIVDKAGIECLFSYRTIERIALLKSTLETKELLDIALFKGLPEEDVETIVNYFASNDDYKYYKKNPYVACLCKEKEEENSINSAVSSANSSLFHRAYF